jgi:uncharacterized protein YecE (DUF72 family)
MRCKSGRLHGVLTPCQLFVDLTSTKAAAPLLSCHQVNALLPTYPVDQVTKALHGLAAQGIYLGTSSWKYPGWQGLLYTPELYRTRGRFSRAKFEKTSLYEYAKVFKTVCLDGGFYQFPTAKMMEGLLSHVPSDFRMSIKVTEDITVRKFPNLPRYGKRAGQFNGRFLDADLFVASFLSPLEPHRNQIGALIFEFGHFHPGDWERGRQFVETLDPFLARLPKGWNYAVEVRNASLLQPEYFQVLRRHGVAHVFNSWSKMPPVTEQLKLAGSFTADFAAARFLLKSGRTFEQAVEKFKPYTEIKEPNPEVRTALAHLLTTPAPADQSVRRFLYVNNRLEGCALWTIYAAITGLLAQSKDQSPPAGEDRTTVKTQISA